jgi:predicted MFS family arabinose efflux permease
MESVSASHIDIAESKASESRAARGPGAPNCTLEKAAPAPWQLYSNGRRFLFLGVLFLIATSNYFDYFVISVLLDPIKREFHVSDATLGLLSGLCFAILYAITALPIARLADRGNRKTVMTVAMSAWSVATALCGLAHSFWQLAAARLAVGAVEPGALPPAQSLIADYFPPERRASAMAIVSQGGSASGWLFGVGVGGYLAVTHGWRATFIIAGIPGVALACVAWCVLQEPRLRLGFPQKSTSSEDLSEELHFLWTKRAYVILLAATVLYAIFTYGLATFLPSFMVRSLHASMERVALPWGATISVANICGAIAGGLLADRLAIRDIRWYAWIPAWGCGLGIPLYACVLEAHSIRGFMITDFIAEFVNAAAMPPVFVALQAVSGVSRRTLAIAVVLLLFSLLGSGLGPPLVGAVSDALSSAYANESLRYSLLALLAFLVPSAILFYWGGIRLPADLDE